MPEIPKKALQKLLVNLMESPQALKKLKSDPKTFISKSPISGTHKKILLSSDVNKIKNTVAKAVAEIKFFPHVQAGAAEPMLGLKTASGIKRVKVKGAKAFPFHIVFGAGQVKVSLKKKAAKTKTASPQGLEAFAIHVTSSSGNS